MLVLEARLAEDGARWTRRRRGRSRHRIVNSLGSGRFRHGNWGVRYVAILGLRLAPISSWVVDPQSPLRKPPYLVQVVCRIATWALELPDAPIVRG